MKLLLALLFMAFSLAATPAQEVVSLEGRVVCCAECWAEADRTKVNWNGRRSLKFATCVANVIRI